MAPRYPPQADGSHAWGPEAAGTSPGGNGTGDCWRWGVALQDARRAVRDGLRGLFVPRVVNATVAAGLAWLVLEPVGGALDRYAYYAPLGAVMAVSSTVVQTVRASLESLAAIVAGALLGTVVLQLPIPDLVGVMLVVAVGMWLTTLDRLGGRGSWVTWSGIFILVVGQSDPVAYGLAYAGLTAVGAIIGILVNMLVPPLPLGASAAAVTRLQSSLADQLDDLADGLDGTEPPTPDDWAKRRHDLEPLASQMDRSLGWADEARRANWRARRWRGRWEQQHSLGVALREMYFLLAHLRDVVMTAENTARERLALGGGLRPATAELLRRVAELLRTARDDGEEAGRARDRAWAALDELVEELRRERQRSTDDFFTAGAVVTVTRQAITALEEVAEEAERST